MMAEEDTLTLPEITVRPDELLPPPPGLPRAPVKGQAAPVEPVAPAAVGDTAQPQGPWWSGVATEAPAPAPEPTPSTHPGGKPWWEDVATADIGEPPKPDRVMGKGESAAVGFEHGLSFGAAPAMHGLAEAGREPTKKFEKAMGVPEGSIKLPAHIRAAQGAAEMLANFFTNHEDPEVKAAYERGREAALNKEKLAAGQHPAYYLGGTLGGAVSMPVLGTMRAAGVGGRAVQGMAQGGAAGGLFGAGEAISEDKSAGEVAKGAGKGAVIGGVLGAGVGATVGPRLAAPGATGERAARTAEELGAPLPRGVVSDNRIVQQTTNKLRQMPMAGERIPQRVEATGEAAGERVGQIAEGMFGGPPERAVADAAARPALRSVIDANNAAIDAGYAGLRGQINHDTQQFAMPRTDAALTRVMQARQAAGHANPAEGLDQFRRVAGGATFNGAQRARTDARNAGDVLNPQPGFNAADFNQITRAMTGDLREMVQAGATNQTPAGRAAALHAFEEAETRFGQLADQNRLLNRLQNAQGEGAIAKLLGASRETSGNVRLLAQLRQSMPQDEFQQIGGLLLHEVGHMPSTGEFSLSKFATGWDKVSEGAKRVLFTPEHVRNLDDIAAMGMHIKQATTGSSTSHSANALVLLEVFKDLAFLAAGAAHGDIGAAAGAAAGVSAAGWGLTRFLASPAGAASAGAFTRAYRGVTLGSPTPARVAIFKIATKNLANQLGVPADKVMSLVASKIGAKAEPDTEDKGGVKQ